MRVFFCFGVWDDLWVNGQIDRWLSVVRPITCTSSRVRTNKKVTCCLVVFVCVLPVAYNLNRFSSLFSGASYESSKSVKMYIYILGGYLKSCKKNHPCPKNSPKKVSF